VRERQKASDDLSNHKRINVELFIERTADLYTRKTRFNHATNKGDQRNSSTLHRTVVSTRKCAGMKGPATTCLEMCFNRNVIKTEH